jgi:multidrug transporter EmrE-like cation transporter
MNKLLLFASCVLAVAADMLLVWWAKKSTHPSLSLILGLALVNAGALVWAYTMKKGIESATAITFYALFTVAGCSLLGFLVFKEHLTRINAIGLVLALIALVMISL